MTESATASDAPAVGSRWWLLALAAIAVACVVIPVAAFDGGSEAAQRVLWAAVAMLAYLVYFFFVIRRARAATPAAYVCIGVTVVAAGVFTAIYPANATFQFWIYPLIWVLADSTVVAIASSGLHPFDKSVANAGGG